METLELAINIKLPGYKKYLDEQYVRTLEPNPSDIKKQLIPREFAWHYSSIHILEWIFKVFDEDAGGSIDIDEVIKIVIGLFNMNGEIKDKEEILAAVIEIVDIIDEDGNGEITKEEFVSNAMKSGFIRNLMEFFNDDEDENEKEIREESQEEPRTEENNEEDNEEDNELK